MSLPFKQSQIIGEKTLPNLPFTFSKTLKAMFKTPSTPANSVQTVKVPLSTVKKNKQVYFYDWVFEYSNPNELNDPSLLKVFETKQEQIKHQVLNTVLTIQKITFVYLANNTGGESWGDYGHFQISLVGTDPFQKQDLTPNIVLKALKDALEPLITIHKIKNLVHCSTLPLNKMAFRTKSDASPGPPEVVVVEELVEQPGKRCKCRKEYCDQSRPFCVVKGVKEQCQTKPGPKRPFSQRAKQTNKEVPLPPWITPKERKKGKLNKMLNKILTFFNK